MRILDLIQATLYTLSFPLFVFSLIRVLQGSTFWLPVLTVTSVIVGFWAFCFLYLLCAGFFSKKAKQ